jgi:hypothetical protein
MYEEGSLRPTVTQLCRPERTSISIFRLVGFAVAQTMIYIFPTFISMKNMYKYIVDANIGP